MHDDLDSLLTQPLPEIAPDNFTEQVLRRISIMTMLTKLISVLSGLFFITLFVFVTFYGGSSLGDNSSIIEGVLTSLYWDGSLLPTMLAEFSFNENGMFGVSAIMMFLIIGLVFKVES